MRSLLALGLVSFGALGACAAACSSPPDWSSLGPVPVSGGGGGETASGQDGGSSTSATPSSYPSGVPMGQDDAGPSDAAAVDANFVFTGGNGNGQPPPGTGDGKADSSAPPPAAPPPLPSAEMFVHIHGGKPQWWALWVPATAQLKNGMKDPADAVLETAIAGGNWPPPEHFTLEEESTRGDDGDGGYYGYGDDGGADAGSGITLTTGGQCGSSTCTCYTGENYSPLLIDLGGHGVSLFAPNAGARFDIAGTGEPLLVSWPTDGRANAFLVLDRDGDGRIESVNEMFGDGTVGPDGARASNGFEALRKYDANADGVIDARDPIYPQLRVWRDDGDAVTQPNELVPLAVAGVTQVSLRYVRGDTRLDYFGNEARERSNATLGTGGSAAVYDLWFVPGFER